MLDRVLLRLRGPARPWCDACAAGAHAHGWRHYVCTDCRDIFCTRHECCRDVGGHEGPCWDLQGPLEVTHAE